MRSRLTLISLKVWFKGGLNRWRVAFLIFAFVYAVFLLLNLSSMSMIWDELPHLNGGMLILRGNFQEYFSFNAFYPPMSDIFTAAFFSVAGISVFTGRLVSVVFSLLSLYVVFEFAYRTYGAKTGLIASVFLGLMPGYVWLSRTAMTETMFIFFFTVSALLFFTWLRLHQNKHLILSGLMLGVGVLVKYQTIILGAIMLTSLILLGRGYLKKNLSRLPLLILIVVAAVLPWIVVSYQLYASGMLNNWLYALEIGNPDKSLYSVGLNSFGISRFPQPYGLLPSWLQISTFYIFELTIPYPDTHPISLFLYVFGLIGLGWFAWRRKTLDKYLLIWFFAVYIFFTLISNRQWRYLVPVFPVLALSAANLLTSALGKSQSLLRNTQLNLNKRRTVQIAAGLLIALTIVGSVYSINDAYSWVAKDQVYIPIKEATDYVAARLAPNESIMVMNTQKLFGHDMVRFYLNLQGKNNAVLHYPDGAVDTYTPNFNITEFINECKQGNVKYVFTYEYGGDEPYFNTTLTLHKTYEMLYASGNFSQISGEATFGTNPRRIFILTFLG